MKQYFFYLILFFHISLNACINHHNNFDTILNYIDTDDHHPYTIVLLDIDNTIAAPAGTFVASDQWVSHHMKIKMKEGLSARQAWMAIKDLYVYLQHQIDLMLIEEITATIIKELQSRGIIVIAITARLPEIGDRTIMQLSNIGIEFSSLWHEELLGNENLSYHYKQGIIFCDGNDKGKVFEDIVKRINKSFTKIIAVDDKENNLKALQKVVLPSVKFIGIRYGYLDTIVSAFDHEQAELDLQKYLVTIQ